MKRYDLIQTTIAYSSDHEMELSDDGEWVRYEDVEALLRAAAERSGIPYSGDSTPADLASQVLNMKGAVKWWNKANQTGFINDWRTRAHKAEAALMESAYARERIVSGSVSEGKASPSTRRIEAQKSNSHSVLLIVPPEPQPEKEIDNDLASALGHVFKTMAANSKQLDPEVRAILNSMPIEPLGERAEKKP